MFSVKVGLVWITSVERPYRQPMHLTASCLTEFWLMVRHLMAASTAEDLPLTCRPSVGLKEGAEKRIPVEFADLWAPDASLLATRQRHFQGVEKFSARPLPAPPQGPSHPRSGDRPEIDSTLALPRT